MKQSRTAHEQPKQAKSGSQTAEKRYAQVMLSEGSMSVDVVRAAYEAGIAGDVEPLVSLIHPQMEWRGRRRLRQFWRPPPS